ncbi:MAG: RrF2 family transcriptional regulator [Candidatus Kapaibacterium sp.]
MTAIFSKKCELALQAVLFLSAQEPSKRFNAQEIADHLTVPKEFLSKILQSLTSEGIIGSKKGKFGGFYLAKPASEIRLIDIVMIIDGLEMFHKCVLGFRGCSVEEPCPVHGKWGKLRDETYRMLSEETLEDLRDQTMHKINTLK